MSLLSPIRRRRAAAAAALAAVDTAGPDNGAGPGNAAGLSDAAGPGHAVGPDDAAGPVNAGEPDHANGPGHAAGPDDAAEQVNGAGRGAAAGASAAGGEPASVAPAPRAAVKYHDRPDGRRGGDGVLRSARLFRLFLDEQSDPERFYTGLAEDAVRQVEDYCEVAGRTVVDVGGGAGYFTAAFRARGARCYLFEPDPGEMGGEAAKTASAVVADGYWLPVRDGGADIAFSSNVLEHVSDPVGLIDEMVRATRPGGLIYLSYTNWYSPWGGHETSPWHYLGPTFAERRYARKYHRAPKNRYGISLFPLHVGPVLRMLRARTDIEIVDARPRYYPRWCRVLLRIPGLREIATWNLLLILRRKG
jgi:SAM-dependent methyltransferase